MDSQCDTGSFPCCCNPHKFFTASSFESLVSLPETLGFVVCLDPLLFLLAYLCVNVGSPTWSPTLPCCRSSLPWLPFSASHTSLDECFFNSLVVGLPGSLIFWQFWLFFAFKLVVICARKRSISAYPSTLAGTLISGLF